MRRLVAILTVALYGFIAMDLHEWVRVPRVLVHLLEHHSDLGHHDEEGSDHGHGDEDGHDPFKGHTDEACGAMTLFNAATDHTIIVMTLPSLTCTLVPWEKEEALMAYTGSKWNPPKLA